MVSWEAKIKDSNCDNLLFRNKVYNCVDIRFIKQQQSLQWKTKLIKQQINCCSTTQLDLFSMFLNLCFNWRRGGQITCTLQQRGAKLLSHFMRLCYSLLLFKCGDSTSYFLFSHALVSKMSTIMFFKWFVLIGGRAASSAITN